jgi:peptidoglycan/LPS O-acetylase OafA/YrhL
MFYLPVIALGALATVALSRGSPRRAFKIGLAALGVAVVAVTIAEVTGNLLLFYLGALVGPFGVLVVVIRLVDALRHRYSSNEARRS